MNTSISLKATARFLRAYNHAQGPLRECVKGALADLCRGLAANPKTTLRSFNTVKPLSPTVLEIDLAGAPRMLVHWRDGTLYLLEMGGHEIVPRYAATGKPATEIKRCKPLPGDIGALEAVSYFPDDADSDWCQFANEADPAWLTWLDTQQARAADRIIERTATRTGPREWYFAMLVGGPGTGKTSVLLNLFSRAFDLDLFPQVVVQDQVADFIKRAAGIDLEGFRTTLLDAQDESEGGLLLVDDPHDLDDLTMARWLAQQRCFKSVVVGVDLLQLSGEFRDVNLDKLQAGSGSDLIHLKTCYRQKRTVGEATQRALNSIASSSRFLKPASKKEFADERKRVTSLCNTFEFVNPSGRFTPYPNATLANVRHEVSRLRRAPALWKHWNPYLIAFDDEGLRVIPRDWKDALSHLPDCTTVKLTQALTIKGIEYQHAILVLSENLFGQIENGFSGASHWAYEMRRLLRIPISRAKDSVTVFVHRRPD
jgi:hypothetical protein